MKAHHQPLLHIAIIVLFVAFGIAPCNAQEAADAKNSVEILPVPSDPSDNDNFFMIVEQMPQFPTGDPVNPDGDLDAFKQWVQANIKYPHTSLRRGHSGRFVFSFIVEEDGSVSNIRVLRSLDKQLAEEARQVIASSPRWKPGMEKGKAVRVRFHIPVDYDLGAEYTRYITTPAKDNGQPLERQWPKFPTDDPANPDGDINTFSKWVHANLQYPAELADMDITGRVIVSFIVTEDGAASEVTAVRSPDKILSDETIRVVASSPKWQPGTQQGETVRVKFTMPVEFKLQ